MWQRGGQCPLSCGRRVDAVLCFGTLLTLSYATVAGLCEGYLPEAGQPCLPWHPGRGGNPCLRPKIANSELLTAGNPTV